eukprot:CAMPEP_0202696798 /NCGR_PEP_ID=MMETSP1385-20130828/10122_1 /ASSEMBLY_ACC=CAM_ASM_000861 /TAXON_ID=933848 /ORGANISM="Elphidium margaritaceum" /LENGTH=688 /DNA_ID=CAMNT_0049353085 /DNA_START=217 /DNA_END=2283 /DNA_ORIENTATION=-
MTSNLRQQMSQLHVTQPIDPQIHDRRCKPLEPKPDKREICASSYSTQQTQQTQSARRLHNLKNMQAGGNSLYSHSYSQLPSTTAVCGTSIKHSLPASSKPNPNPNQAYYPMSASSRPKMYKPLSSSLSSSNVLCTNPNSNSVPNPNPNSQNNTNTNANLPPSTMPTLSSSKSQTLLMTHTRSHHQQHPQQQQQQTRAASLFHDTLKKYRIENESFRLWSFYKPSSKKLLGRGGYGVVAEATDTRNGEKVAIKKMKNVFAHLNTAKCSLRELTLLMHFDHPNIIDVIDCMLPEDKNIACYQQVYYVMPKMQSTLKTVCCYSDIDISCNHRCFILYQILNGVLYIHGCDVIHRDIKPENILINSDCTIKITDFGMARGIKHKEDDDVLLSEYVTTRWYRAPEIMLCSRQYKYSVDVWSIACIYCEMILRKPIFAGNNHLEQLELIFDAVGTPNVTDCKSWIKSYDALRWVLSLPNKAGKSLEHDILHYPTSTKCKDVSKNEIDLISKMLILNPNQRSTVQQCVSHRFFKKIPTKIKAVKEGDEFKNVRKFDVDQSFEKQLTKLSSCRQVMLRTLRTLRHKSALAQLQQQAKTAAAAAVASSSGKTPQSQASQQPPQTQQQQQQQKRLLTAATNPAVTQCGTSQTMVGVAQKQFGNALAANHCSIGTQNENINQKQQQQQYGGGVKYMQNF